MKTIILLIIFTALLNTCFSQPIPADSMYLGQVPPGNTPKIFNLPKSTGSFTAERIAISNDGKEIYFSVIRNYYPTSGDTIKFYKYADNRWQGPFSIFSNHLAPAFSVTGDTLFIQNNSMIYQTLYSYRISGGWSEPKRILYGLNNAHYLQVTNNGNYYISSTPANGLGATDWCRLSINGSDTSAVSLRLPLNNAVDNLDFYIAKDESYMIIAKNAGSNSKLHISYHKSDGSWTNPKNLGPAINSGLAAWGPYVSPDDKYLFYTTGTNPNYSDTYVYWVRFDNMRDSLKYTNYIPYLKNQVPSLTDTNGTQFSYTIPESTFVDDDGINTLRYSASLSSGQPLPYWLSFDSITKTFSGIISSSVSLNLRVTVTDTAGAGTSCTFLLNVIQQIGLDPINETVPGEYRLIQNYPNPFNPNTSILFDIPKQSQAILKVYDVTGRETAVLVNELLRPGSYKVELNAGNLSSGVYFYKLDAGNYIQTRKMVLLK